jgi:USP8 interacting
MNSFFTKSTLLILICFIVSCSPKGFMFDGKKLQQVTISDLGEMYSTYNLSTREKTELSNQLTDQNLADEIMMFCKESKWPVAVNTLEKRLNVRTVMMKYNFYKVATIGGDKTIVSIPKDKNKSMPPGFAPDGPMYMIFASAVVKNK